MHEGACFLIHCSDIVSEQPAIEGKCRHTSYTVTILLMILEYRGLSDTTMIECSLCSPIMYFLYVIPSLLLC